MMTYGCLNRGGPQLLLPTSLIAAPHNLPSSYSHGLAMFPQFLGVPMYPQIPPIVMYHP